MSSPSPHPAGKPKTGIVIQARMSSRRVPGKVLRSIAGKPMLGWLIERMRQVAATDEIIVATSSGKDDEAVASYAESLGVRSFRGSLEDVLDRFAGAAREYSLGAIVRVNADSPLLDPVLVSEAVRLFHNSGADLVTNVFPRSFPRGQSVEVMRASALERAAAEARGDEREHVTTHFYAHPDWYRIVNFAAERPRPDVHLAVDTEDDFARTEELLLALDVPAEKCGLNRVLELRDELVLRGKPTAAGA